MKVFNEKGGVTLSLTVDSIDDVDDVNITSIADEDVLQYDSGTSKWINTDLATFKATLDLEIGVDVQAYDAELAAIAGLASAADRLPYFTGSGTASLAVFTAFARTILDDESEAIFKATVNLEDADINTLAIAAVEAAGLVLATAKNIQIFEALSSDHTWSGTTASLTAGENLTIGQICYMKSDGKMWKSNATAVGTMPAIAMATGTINADDSGIFLLSGYFRDSTWTWTVGGILYAEDDTPGDMIQTAPDTTSDQVQVVGIAMAAAIVYFNPGLELVEIT